MRLVSGRGYGRECSGEPQNTCSSALELSKVQIGLETYRSYESRAKRKSRYCELGAGRPRARDHPRGPRRAAPRQRRPPHLQNPHARHPPLPRFPQKTVFFCFARCSRYGAYWVVSILARASTLCAFSFFGQATSATPSSPICRTTCRPCLRRRPTTNLVENSRSVLESG